MKEVKRDAMGLRPSYCCNDNCPEISDSVRSFLKDSETGKLDILGLKSYLAYGAVQEPSTLVDGVKCVPLPEYDEVCKADDGGIADKETLQKAVSDVFEKVVRDAIGDDHEPAAFLSGGIDSSAVVAMMRKVHSGKIKTYCVVHEDAETDERMWAKKVADHLGTEHHELLLTGEMFKEGIPLALKDYDLPSLDGINMWFAAKLVAEAGVKRIFTGTGGDELFVGYGQFSKHRMAYRYGRYLKHMPRFFGKLISAIAPNEKLRKLGALTGFHGDPYYLPRRIFDDAMIKALLKPEFHTDAPFPVLGGDAPQGDLINRISWMECRTSLLSMYLRDGYNMASAHGVELLSPILDERVVKLMFRAPGALKVDPVISKPLLVNAVPGGIPPECVTRKKMGFTLPFDKYFREVLHEELTEFFEGGKSALFNSTTLQKVWKSYLSGKMSWSRVWALYVVEDWYKRNISTANQGVMA